MSFRFFTFRKPYSIRLQLLLAVNFLLGILLFISLLWQYQERMEQAVHEKRSSLTDEAIAVHAAVAHLSHDHGMKSVQRYIDDVCQKMRSEWSPHHHIFVEFGSTLLSDTHLNSGANLQFGKEEVKQSFSASDMANSTSYVSGRYADDLVSIVVSETTDSIRRAARKEVLIQVGIFGILGTLATVTVNVVLLRIVGLPLKKLLIVVKEISAGQFETRAPEFHTYEMQELALSINSMSHALAESEKERRLQMHKARQIQQHLLPNGVRLPRLQAAHIFEPADDVAGDYYDFLPLSNGSWLICLADVTGHGVPAAMGASMLKALLLTESESDSFDLLFTLKNINRRFAEVILPGNFASMFLGCWNPETLELMYASAGHEPAIVLRASGKTEKLDSTGLLIGLDPEANWLIETVQLSSADRVLLFSDGATESLGETEELYGQLRLTKALAANSDYEISTAVTNLFRDITHHRGNCPSHDDLTLVLLGCDDSTTEHQHQAGNNFLEDQTCFQIQPNSRELDLSIQDE